MPRPDPAMTPAGRGKTILITAGEVSGDIIAAELMQALADCCTVAGQPVPAFYGIGGENMRAAGLQELGDMENTFPGMGLFEILGAVPGILRLRRTLTAWAATTRPDLCITVDNQEFSRLLAQRLHALGVPCVQYVAPKVWAWRQGRVRKLQKIFRHVFCLFPFEIEFFTRHGLPATYIGHPVARRLAPLTPEAGGQTALPAPATPRLALLPGSRRAELAYHWPLFLEVFTRLHAENPALTGLVPLASAESLALCRAHGWHPALTPVLGDARFAALQGCTAALTKSGTNNLELALLGLPAVVAYRMHPLSYAIARRVVHVPAISPVNLIARGLHPLPGQGNIYPEYLQGEATPGILQQAIVALLQPSTIQQQTHSKLAQVRHQLATTTPPAAITAATLFHTFLNK